MTIDMAIDKMQWKGTRAEVHLLSFRGKYTGPVFDFDEH